jgi:hypothetical protein
MIKWKNELPKVQKLMDSGLTLQEMGDFYGVSRQQMSSVLKRYFPNTTREEFGASLKRKTREDLWKTTVKRRFNRDLYGVCSDLERAYSAFFTRKRQNVKAQGKWEFLIGMSDLAWPNECPVFGCPLDWFAESRQENSPSIDRINSSEGYIPGNVQIMSWRANRIKNNGTAEEHEKIAQFLRLFDKK